MASSQSGRPLARSLASFALQDAVLPEREFALKTRRLGPIWKRKIEPPTKRQPGRPLNGISAALLRSKLYQRRQGPIAASAAAAASKRASEQTTAAFGDAICFRFKLIELTEFGGGGDCWRGSSLIAGGKRQRQRQRAPKAARKVRFLAINLPASSSLMLHKTILRFASAASAVAPEAEAKAEAKPTEL